METSLIATKPWTVSAAASEIHVPHGMLGTEEREALFWFGKNYCSGDGVVIDAGAYLGTTSFSVASGLAHSENPKAKKCRIFAYDMFVADEPYVADHIAQRFSGDYLGQSFEEIFLMQVGKYQEYIVPIRGNFCDFSWTRQPIEVLHVDLDKSPELHKKFILEYYHSIIPGRGLVFHQDWYLSRHPWIHIAMEYLSDYFALVDPLVKNCTRIFMLTRPIPEDHLNLLAFRQLGYHAELDLLDRLIDRERLCMKEMLRLSKITHMLQSGDKSGAAKEETRIDQSVVYSDPSLESEYKYVSSLLT